MRYLARTVVLICGEGRGGGGDGGEGGLASVCRKKFDLYKICNQG